MECYQWTIGVIFEPKYGQCREVLTKVNQLITTIDDVYDVYGLLDELELFTEAVERWDINAMEELPEYMKICFLALYNTVNEIGYYILIKNVHNVIPYLKKSWVDLCKTYLVEARWYYSGYTPTLDEYLNNAWVSISGPVILTHVYTSMNEMVTKEELDCIVNYPNVMRWSSMILRLADDLGTSTDELERGDVPKSIQCYMHETDCSEAAAREHIRALISDVWKNMNSVSVAFTRLPQPFIGAAMDLARMSQYMYQYGDGFGAPDDHESEDRIISLLVKPTRFS